MYLPGLRLLSSLWGLIVLALAILATWWTYTDAKRKEMMAWLWAAITFLFFPLGFFVYLIARAFSRPKTTT